MEETKQQESAYSGERTAITGPHSLRGTTATADSPKSEEAAPPSEPKQESGMAGSAQNAPIAKPSQKPSVTASPVKVLAPNSLPVNTSAGEYSLAANLLEYLKRTKYVWLSLAVVMIAFMAVITVMKGMAERARIAQEKRHETAAATVTPENLISRCGPAAEDVTKQMYPMVLRTISYRSQESQKVVFEFSRTAEEKSDWVFLSMKDESGAKSYDTPEAKIAALPCLDSTK
jgi:hypothetical protein